MNKIIYLTIFSSLLLASSSSQAELDIVQRSVNFAIFMVLLYKVAYKPLKGILSQRTSEIQEKLEALDADLEESKELKEKAISDIVNAKRKAKEMKTSIASEAKNIASRIESQTVNELLALEKSYQSKKEVEEKKVISALVEEITSEVFADESIIPTSEEISDIILKKVA